MVEQSKSTRQRLSPDDASPDTRTSPRPRPEAPRSVLRVIGIFEAIARHPSSGLSLAALGQELDAPKSSLLNLLRALTASGHLAVRRGAYTLGPQSLSLGRRLVGALGTSDVARQVLQSVHDATGETAIIGVPAGDEITYVASLEPQSTVRAHVVIGQRRPLYSSAGGRALLAFWSDADIDDYLRRTPMAPPTPTAIADRKVLRRELERVRSQGFSITMSEAEIGSGGVAAPILQGNGAPIGCLIVAGPTPRLEPRLEEFTRLVVDAAHNLSETGLEGLSAYRSHA